MSSPRMPCEGSRVGVASGASGASSSPRPNTSAATPKNAAATTVTTRR